MRTKTMIILLVLSFNLIICHGQTVYLYSPNGAKIEAFYNNEMSSSDITYYTNQYRSSYPQAEVLANASSTYNCHSYAWNMSEGGKTVCWLNQPPDLHKYWDDGSYVLTTEASAEKVFYYNGDHSAIVSKIYSGKYESKWGSMPLMRHSPTYGPSGYNMTYRRYYKKTPIVITITSNNAGVICADNNATFTATNFNLVQNVTITWTAGTNMTLVSGQGAQSAVFNTSGNGYATVSAKITYSNGENYTIQNSSVWVGPPNNLTIKTSPYTKLYPGECLELTAYIGSTIGSSYNTYTWSASSLSGVRFNSFTKTNNQTEVSFLNGGRIALKVTATNNCGSATASFIVTVVDTGGALQRSAMVEVEETNSPTLIRVYSVITGLLIHTEKDAANFNIENTSLTHGIYVVETTFENGELSREKVIKKHR